MHRRIQTSVLLSDSSDEHAPSLTTAVSSAVKLCALCAIKADLALVGTFLNVILTGKLCMPAKPDKLYKASKEYEELGVAAIGRHNPWRSMCLSGLAMF